MATFTTTTQPASTHQPAPHATLRRLVARHPATAFLVMAFAFGWTTLLPLLLSERGFGVLPIDPPVTVFQFLASIIGLTLPAFLVAAATGGAAGVRDLLRRALRWRVGVHWYLIALLGTFVAVLLAAIPLVGVAPLQLVARKWGSSSRCSCRACSCRSCTRTCRRRSAGRRSRPGCRSGAGPSWRASL